MAWIRELIKLDVTEDKAHRWQNKNIPCVVHVCLCLFGCARARACVCLCVLISLTYYTIIHIKIMHCHIFSNIVKVGQIRLQCDIIINLHSNIVKVGQIRLQCDIILNLHSKYRVFLPLTQEPYMSSRTIYTMFYLEEHLLVLTLCRTHMAASMRRYQ